MIRRSALLFALALLAACGTPPPAPQAEAGRFPPPDRPVAEIVAPSWSPEAERDAVGEFAQVARILDLKPGMAVADIGAGSGYYVVRLSPVVGPQGRVYANDIIPSYLTELEARVRGLGLANVTLVEGAPDDARLPPAAVDVALMIHMYHEIEQPYGLLHRLAASMKPGGRLAILDQPARPERHGTPPDLLRCELAAVGWRQLSIQPLENDNAYVAVFVAPSAGALPRPEDIRPCKLAG